MDKLGILKPNRPYNFDLTLDLLERYTHPALDVVYKGSYWRLLHSRGGLSLVRVESTGSIDSPSLKLSLAMSTCEPDKEDLTRQISHVLGIDDKVRKFYKMAKGDKNLWGIVKPLVGLRWLKMPTVFEALMYTIIEQQITWVKAQEAQHWLCEWGGQSLTHKKQAFYAFPRPRQIAKATVEDLRPLKITFKRIQAMIDIAKQVHSGELDLEAIRTLPPQEAYDRLTAIKGIGHWTATWTIQRTLPGHNYVGYNDVALQAATNRYFYQAEGKLPVADVKTTFDAYGDFAGLAAHYTLMRWVMDRYEVRMNGNRTD